MTTPVPTRQAELFPFMDPAKLAEIEQAKVVLAAAVAERDAVERALRAKYGHEEELRRQESSTAWGTGRVVNYGRPLPGWIDSVGGRVQADHRFISADDTARLARADLCRARRQAHRAAQQAHYLATCSRGVEDRSPRGRLDRLRVALKDPAS